MTSGHLFQAFRRLRLSMAIGALLAPCFPHPAHGEILVQILDLTDDVRVHEPIFVTYSIENTGSEPELVPAEAGVAMDGVAVCTGREGEPLRFEPEVVFARLVGGSTQNVWLDPGERWLFVSEISEELDGVGVFKVQAVLKSSGECGGFVVGPTRHDLEPLYIEGSESRANRPLYRCWEGKARSNVWNVTVVESQHPDEAQAAAFEGSWWELIQLYPRTAYSYGVLARMSHFEAAMAIQPFNPLNDYLRALRLRKILYRSSPCVPERYRRAAVSYSIEDLDVPQAVKAYLSQVEWYEQNRDCGAGNANEEE